MNILLIESNHMDAVWLRRYMERYSTDVQVLAAPSIAEAIQMLKDEVHHIDVVLVDFYVQDLHAPASIYDLISCAPSVPIVGLETGKSSQPGCVRVGLSRVFQMKTDVSTDTFHNDLCKIVAKIQQEQHAPAEVARDEPCDGRRL